MNSKVYDIVIDIKDIEEKINDLNKIKNKHKEDLEYHQSRCPHKKRTIIIGGFNTYVYCKHCTKLLGYKCGNREDSPCSYNLKPFNYHAQCRHGCGRLFEDDCQ